MPLIWPLATPVFVVQDFCSWEWTHPHQALDLQAANGTTIVAIQDGRVSFVGDRNDQYGNTVEITHEQDNLLSKYSHMSSFLVTQDQEVRQGDPLGLSGHTGTGSGPHLHFALARLSDVSSYLWENGSSPGGFDPCLVMPNAGVSWDANARAGPDSTVTGNYTAGCPQCPQEVAPSGVTTGPFRSISKIEYSVTTSQSEAVSKDCPIAPYIGNPAGNQPGVNHIASVALANPTGAPMSRRFVVIFSPALGGATVPIQSPATVEAVQAALDAAIGAGNVVVTYAPTHGSRAVGLFDG
jgi:hypothetical protein